MRQQIPLLAAACFAVLLALLPRPANTEPAEAGDEAPALDERGWHPGVAAANTASVLTPVTPAPVELPAPIASRIERRTFLFYFSPTCGHCKDAAPGVVALAGELGDEMDFLAVASASANPSQVEEFQETYGVPFPWVLDEDRAFARAVGARSTPTVVVIEPVAPEGDGARTLQAVDLYGPWFEGAGALMKMRMEPSNPFASFTPGVYQGRYVCSTCHSTETDSWAMTHHAVAYRTLYTRDRTQDLKCVGCHVTGMDEPTGFQPGDHGSPLGGVTCEACHSAGGPHDGERVDAESTCEGCHDADHSIAFTYEKGLPHIDHYLSTSMTEAEMDARFRAIRDGELDRPLLAFPEGNYVGVAACKSCHPAQHKDWRRSPHRDGMASLSTEEAGRIDCVRCHSSPAGEDPEPETLDGYRIGEGVGCESCHGPGESHVAAPTADNIIGLGESCPECVIEEICTSCHTKRWSPNWDLDERLEAVRH